MDEYDDEYDELLRGARSNLQRIMSLSTQLNLRFTELQPAPWGVGILMKWDDHDWIVLSISGGDEDTLFITAGLRRDVSTERLPILEACNTLTRDNPAYPVFLHDAELGPDVFMQTSVAVEVALDQREVVPAPNGVPRPFIEHMCLSFPPTAAAARQQLAADPRIGGRPYTLESENVTRLLNRSML